MILRNNKEFYRQLLIPLSLTHPLEGYYFERSWDLIFKKNDYNPDQELLNKNLINASWNGDFKNVKLAIELGADVNTRHSLGATALYMASKKCHIDIIKYLISEKANLELSTDDGATPLHSVILNNCNEGAQILLNAGASPEAKFGNHVVLNGAIQNKNIEGVKLLLNAGARIFFDEYYTPLMNAGYSKDKSSENQEIYNLITNHYWKLLEQFHKDNEIISNKSFEVVIVRYKEDLSWVKKEFLTEKVTIYNKGPDDLGNLPSNCEVRKMDNIGFTGGTYLYHIVNNYDNLADRTLFVQGLPYDQEVILPLVRHQLDIESNCKNIIAKCQNTTITKEAEELKAYSEEEWRSSKYSAFEPIEYDMYHFARHFVNPYLDENAVLKMALGAQMAVDKLKILTHSKDYYQDMLKEFGRRFPRQDFFLEKLWDEVFEPEDFLCYGLKSESHRINQFLQEGFVYKEERKKIEADAKEKLLSLEESENRELKVPLISHQVYFTDIDNPKIIDLVSLNKTLYSLNNLNRANDNWRHFLWTNYPEIIQEELRDIKNLEILNYNNNHIYNISDSFLGSLTDEAIKNRFYSEASDLARYASLIKIGGMYRDLDFEIYQGEGMTKLFYNFNLVAGTEADCPYSLYINGFIIATPGHPVIRKTIELIYRNKIDRTEIPDYIKYPCNNLNRIVSTTGPFVFTLAYFIENNIKGNNDIVMPYGILSNTNYSRSTTINSRCYDPSLDSSMRFFIGEKKFELLGADMNCGSWYAGNLDDIRYKKNSNIYITEAAFKGDFDLVRWSLDNGADVDYRNPDFLFATALYLAVQGGYYDIVELLLERGAKTELLTNSGTAPLHLALQGGNRIVDLLLEHGANPNNKKRDTYSPVYIAVYFNNLEALKALIAKGAIIDDDELNQLKTLANEKENIDIIEFLENYSEPYGEEMTGIDFVDTARKGNLDLVNHYLNQGADINYRSDNFSSATALYMAVQEGHYNIVKLLLENAADTEIAANNGVTPLHRAAQDNSLDILKLLLEYRANPNVKNNRGISPIYVAEYLKLDPIYDLLVENGAAIEKSDYAIDRLEDAIYKGKFGIVNALLKSGITMYVDKRHPTLPLVAKDYYTIHSYKNYVDLVYNDILESIKTAIELKLNLNVKFSFGLNFLFFALLAENEEIFIKLLQNGADSNSLTEQGYSLLTIAAYLNEQNIVNLLLDYNSNPNLKQARLPLFAATYQGNYEIVNNLLSKGATLNSDRTNPIFTALSFHHPKYGIDEKLYNLEMDKYFNQTAELNKNISSLKNDNFEVVVVRYNEDLNWIEKEFGAKAKVTIYNKGIQDLDYLPSNYNLVNIANVGYLGGTYLFHIAENYPNFSNRVLFLQGWPYDSALLKLPMLKYSYTSETSCPSVIGECMKTSIHKEDMFLSNINWKQSKYKNFDQIEYNLTSYAQEFVNKSIEGSDTILVPYAALFAVDRDKILANSLEYYAKRLPLFDKRYPIVDHFQERLSDLDFYDINNSFKISELENSKQVTDLGEMFIAGYTKIDEMM